MKAAIFQKTGMPLEIVTVADPVPAPDEVIVRVVRCGICSSDLHMTEQHNDMLSAGAILGHEMCGEVVAVGSGARRIKVGDRVTALPIGGCGRCASCVAGDPAWCREGWHIRSGGYAEYMRTYERDTVQLPDSLVLADAALIEPLTIGLRGVIEAGIRPGASVLVVGAGPIGLGAAFWASRLGAGRIAVIAQSDRRRAMALQMGATAFIGGSDDPAGAVNDALHGAPEVVFECVGKPGAISSAMDFVRPRGTVVVLGFCMTADTFMPVNALFKGLTVKFSMCASLEQFETAAAVLGAGHIEPRSMVTETVSLGALPAMFEALKGANGHCKVLVDPTQAWAA